MSEMKFVISKPLPVATRSQDGGRVVDKSKLGKMLRENPGTFGTTGGCYVFSMGAKPWYVGKTGRKVSTQIYKSEKTMNRVLQQQKSGTLRIWTVTGGAQGKLSKRAKASLDEMESSLIKLALGKNPKLLNLYRIRGKHWFIEGLQATGHRKLSGAAADFSKMIGFDDRFDV